jgi:hypothetical protein
MEILRERMRYHKDKFVSRRLYDELCELEVKKNGRIEHTSNGHDDQVFSYLLALYVWYEGKDLMTRFGIEKGTIKTEDDFDSDEILYDNNVMTDVTKEIVEDNEEVAKQLNVLNSNKAMSQSEFAKQQQQQSIQAMNDLLQSNPLAMREYCERYHADPKDINPSVLYSIPDSTFNSFYDDSDDIKIDPLQNEYNNIVNLR